MVFLETPEQAIEQIIVCFSFLIFIFVLSLNRKKSAIKAFAAIFAVPLAFTVIGFINPGHEFKMFVLQYVGLIIIAGIFIYTLTRQLGFGANILLMAVYIFLIIFIRQSKLLLPTFFYSSLFIGGITAGITIMAIVLWKIKLKDHQHSIYWGILILGVSQALRSLYPEISPLLLGAGNTAAFALFFSYSFTKTLGPYNGKIKQAELALEDFQKAVKYRSEKTSC
jgi:hypothetical protein